MTKAITERFRSGEVCAESGMYEFDGYLNGSSELLPTPEEMEIWVASGNVFPLVFSSRRACFWSPIRRQEYGSFPDAFV